MHKIDRYVMKTVGGAMFLVMVVVLSLDLIFAFIAELDDTANNYQTIDALWYVFLTLPRRIYDYLPLGAFMGCLVGLGSMASSSELTVIRAAGVSIKRIVWSAMKPALFVVLLGVGIGEYLAPPAERIAQSEKAVALGAGSNVAAASGLWHREGNVFIHMNAVQPSGVLFGISLFRFNEQRQLLAASFAERAIYQGDHWILENVQTTKLAEQGTTRVTHNQLRWESGLSPSVLSVLIVKPENLAMTGLLTYARYLDEQGLSASRYWLAFWKKTLMPLGTAVMVLVAISFIFGPLRSVTMGFRVFTGLLVGLSFKYMQDLLGPMSVVYGFDPILAVLVPIAVNAGIGILLMRRAG
ncbi:LPS export ABC transporter permease LptG [Marinobacter psychrophilus]|jgi:lipopolysaccharide export system permease protein|uniref:LPS export ABC transporter permease LptG n=1 Tax=Marinobacter psychrophilus TaxID=330734 RepID=UPI001B546E27|nr:LPS export ABC transporter permease LptG [Marinobacter psychrophilus]MBQ0761537.1 LPS export ABC transporter permease LptG [Marinobacter psychrophilus]MBQ0845813.1 LPS export ABC transporter permease LptG [Marinobacter psychrophilus]